ncbi:MAG: HU family DNA-binding protein [bacterium]
MVRAELVNQLSKRQNITKKKSSCAVNVIFQSITKALERGDKVELRGFGSFTVRSRQSRKGRNPKTGAIVDVPEKKVPFYRPGKDLKIVK